MKSPQVSSNVKSSGELRRYSLHAVALASLLACASLSTAQTATGPQASQLPSSAPHTAYPEIERALAAEVPDVPIDTIKATQIDGVFAVTSGHSVIYTDRSGKYVITGHIFEAGTKRDMTAEMLADLNKIDLSTLPMADSFTEVFGNGKRQLYVFSDPDCPFCKKLEGELPKLTNTTVHIFMFPIVALHPDARTHSVGIWCSKDRGQAWHDKLVDGVVPTAASCDTPVDRNVDLALKLGINATPTLIFPDGKMLAGAMPADRVNAMLDASVQK